ncbi:OprO/OprP family phosphate-selective porin [Marichromatium gracile]|uniref:porin n=1 Tax=Marichromatium gracile TaxID=1048 RepID=UPI001F21D22C|nr:porin [Marichromatium gracile]MCF1183748.1 OprO/OprP family phosphate-selective porin [Marichromatium gracile]
MTDSTRMRALALGAALLAPGLAPGLAQAANWLLLQGSEPEQGTRALRPWGFAQLAYQRGEDTPIPVGGWTGQGMAANRLGPDKRAAERWQLHRLRLGVRGRVPGGAPLDYLVAVEAGDNGATREGDELQLIDASLSYRIDPALRLRLGQFKPPGSEEALRPAPRQPYFAVSTAVDQLLNETFLDHDGSDPLDANAPRGPRSLYHDIGAQLFGVLPGGGPWAHSYALMLGNGNGVARLDNDSHKDLYLYWSSEHVEGGRGAARQGTKLFGWWQQGRRELDGADPGSHLRTRAGAGVIHQAARWRLSGESLVGRGMILAGSDGGAVPGSWNNAATRIAGRNLLPEGEAEGWYLEGGWRLAPRTWLDLRYDRYDRGTESAADHRRFTTWTLGLRYRIDRHWQVMANYQWREAEAPGLDARANANRLLAALDDRLALQLQFVY